MALNIEQILNEHGRRWMRQPGASLEEIDRLLAASPCELPAELIELLQFSNGGEGELALKPRLFVLDPVSEIIEGIRDDFLKDHFQGFLFFGGNGAGERIALDCRAAAPPFPVVTIDPIAGPDSAEAIAYDIETFVKAIGLEHPRDEQDDA